MERDNSKISKVKAIRTNCFTGKVKEVEVEVQRQYFESNLNSWWYCIVSGGVTGYESCECKKLNPIGGWSACAGTPQRWDTLFIPEESCKQFISELAESEAL